MPKVEFEDSLLNRLNLGEEEFERTVRENSALFFYAHEKLTLGQAAERAGKSQQEFMQMLADSDIPAIRYFPEELKRELNR